MFYLALVCWLCLVWFVLVLFGLIWRVCFILVHLGWVILGLLSFSLVWFGLGWFGWIWRVRLALVTLPFFRSGFCPCADVQMHHTVIPSFSFTECPSSWVSSADCTSVHTHPTCWQDQESSSSNTTQTQATKLVQAIDRMELEPACASLVFLTQTVFTLAPYGWGFPALQHVLALLHPEQLVLFLHLRNWMW